jgi:hypothetical protein
MSPEDVLARTMFSVFRTPLGWFRTRARTSGFETTETRRMHNKLSLSQLRTELSLSFTVTQTAGCTILTGNSPTRSSIVARFHRLT